MYTMALAVVQNTFTSDTCW